MHLRVLANRGFVRSARKHGLTDRALLVAVGKSKRVWSMPVSAGSC